VYSIEIEPSLGVRAERSLARLGVTNVRLRVGDGRQGWPEAAPFDAIMVTASAGEGTPTRLVEQLKLGGKMALPIGTHDQVLHVITKTAEGVSDERLFGVRFVPLRGADAKTVHSQRQ